MPTCGRFVRVLGCLVRDESGPTATEYAILLALLVLVAVVAIRGIGERIFNIYLHIDGVMPD